MTIYIVIPCEIILKDYTLLMFSYGKSQLEVERFLSSIFINVT